MIAPEVPEGASTGSQGSWHLDKRLPVSILFAIFMQTAGAIWWASKVESRLEYLSVQDRAVLSRVDNLEATRLAFREKIGAMETNIANTARIVERMDNKLDGLREDRGLRNGRRDSAH